MIKSPKPSRKRLSNPNTNVHWSGETELVGLVFELVPKTTAYLPLQYSVGLHAWFLDQVRQLDPELSAYLHDGESEKSFTISGLEGVLLPCGRQLQLQPDQTYRWYVTALSQRVVQWLEKWLQQLPPEVTLRQVSLQISSWAIAFTPTTYAQLFYRHSHSNSTIALSFLTPTSFRRKGHHLPLPWPVNVFHSYLRRWNDFAGMPFNQETFLAQIDERTIIHRHRLESVKVAAGKRGSVTGFTGAIEFGLSKTDKSGEEQAQFERLFYALGELAPYSGTGHKTTFGLGQTRLGWLLEEVQPIAPAQNLLAKRILELTDIFLQQRQRLGGHRAQDIAENFATILARRELGESLLTIAEDLEMPYETVKTYVKLARRSLRNFGLESKE